MVTTTCLKAYINRDIVLILLLKIEKQGAGRFKLYPDENS